MRLRKSLIFLSSYLPVFLFLATPIHAWTGDDTSSGSPVATIQSLEGLFANILGAALRLIGLATFIMIIVGGFQYLTTGGDPKATETARNTITYGILGLVLTIVAWFILSAIAGFTGITNLLQFQVTTFP